MGDAFADVSELTRRSHIQRHLRFAMFGLVVADFLVVLAAVGLAWNTRMTIDVWATDFDYGTSLASAAAPWIVIAWMLVLAAQGAYTSRVFGAGTDEFRSVLQASLITAGAVGMFSYLTQLNLSRGFVLLLFAYGTPLLLVERYLYRQVIHQIRAHGRMQHRVIAVGGPSGISEVVDVLRRERYVGYEVVGACIPDGILVDSDALDIPVLGSVEKTRQACELVGADTVLVARGGYSSSSDLRQIAWDLQGSDIDLVVVPSLTDVAGPRIHMRPVAGLPLLHLEEPNVAEAGGWAKRAFDVVFSFFLIVLLLPLLLAVAVSIKIQDGGPVFFRQLRVGRQANIFGMVKFRSMVPNAEEVLEDLLDANEFDSTLFKIRDDPRMTRVGRFLRKYSLDELPQLFNVLRGEMSLVGPRPPLQREVDTYGSDVRRRLLVRPGMTGLWQVSGRSSLSWKESVRLDLYYVDNWSMTTDLLIMAKTVKAVLASNGAY